MKHLLDCIYHPQAKRQNQLCAQHQTIFLEDATYQGEKQAFRSKFLAFFSFRNNLWYNVYSFRVNMDIDIDIQDIEVTFITGIHKSQFFEKNVLLAFTYLLYSETV